MKFTMPATLAVFLIAATSAFAQTLGSPTEGATYDREGRLSSYKYADGTRELYSYDQQSRMSTFTDRAGKMTQFATNDGRASNATASPTTATAVDSTLFTTYSLDAANGIVYWLVCGSTANTSGCYSSGSLGPFGRVGALIEGNPTVDSSTNTVTRRIFVLDVESGTNNNAVTLYVYNKTDTISPDYDSVSVTLVRSSTLGLVGGSSASGLMAANNKFLIVSTNLSSRAILIQKSNFAVTRFSGGNFSSITADKYGYITVTSGSLINPGPGSGDFILDPNGNVVQSGGNTEFMLNTVQGTLPETFP